MCAGCAKCERGYKLCSGPTEHMEDAPGHGAANDLFPDGAHACAGDCLRLRQRQPVVQQTQLKDLEDRQGPPEPASVPNVRFGQSTNRILPIEELHDEALKYFEKQALLLERNVAKACEEKEIDRLTSVISAMERQQIQRAEIHLPTWHISVQGRLRTLRR